MYFAIISKKLKFRHFDNFYGIGLDPVEGFNETYHRFSSFSDLGLDGWVDGWVGGAGGTE